MKNSSTLIQALLIAAVAFLYFLHFSGKHPDAVTSTPTGKDTSAARVKFNPKELKASRIVFVNADSLYVNYEAARVLKKETSTRQSQLESVYKQKAERLQQDYGEFQQKATQGGFTQEQGKQAEAELMKRKEDLDGMEKQLAGLADEFQKKNGQINTKISQFLKAYNKEGRYSYILSYSSLGGSLLLGADSLDITRDVVGGLNEEYTTEHKKTGN
jgi:outer membrane protein